jgi:hypothetical protein
VALKILFFVLWIPASIVAALVVFRLSRRETHTVAVALLAGALTLAGLVVYPRTIKATAASAHRYEQLWSTNKNRPGGAWDCLTFNLRTCVRESVWGELRRTIPKHDRYYVQTEYGLVRFWTFTSLLPRIAVERPRDADWVISYRGDPKTLGVRYSKLHTIRHVYASGAYSIVLGKVAK